MSLSWSLNNAKKVCTQSHISVFLRILIWWIKQRMATNLMNVQNSVWWKNLLIVCHCFQNSINCMAYGTKIAKMWCVCFVNTDIHTSTYVYISFKYASSFSLAQNIAHLNLLIFVFLNEHQKIKQRKTTYSRWIAFSPLRYSQCFYIIFGS